MIWVQACRPKTLIASIAPIFLGTTWAFREGYFHPMIFLFTLLTTLGIQIGTNLTNDYFDGIKGADTSLRKGPVRAVAAGLVSLKTMRRAILGTLTVTGVLSFYLIWHGGLVIALLSTLSLLLALAYTAGPYPLAYVGLGDLFVLFFFGPIAVSGTFFLQSKFFSWPAFILGFGPGLLSTAILTINNLRDKDEDAKVKKQTLCVRFGKTFGKIEYITCMIVAALLPLFLGYFSSLFILVPGFFLIRQLNDEEKYNSLLAKTGGLLFIYTILLSGEGLFKSLQ